MANSQISEKFKMRFIRSRNVRCRKFAAVVIFNHRIWVWFDSKNILNFFWQLSNDIKKICHEIYQFRVESQRRLRQTGVSQESHMTANLIMKNVSNEEKKKIKNKRKNILQKKQTHQTIFVQELGIFRGFNNNSFLKQNCATFPSVPCPL